MTSGDWVVVTDPKDPSSTAALNLRTGDFSFTNGLSGYFGNTKPDLPEQKEGAGLAKEYLAHNGFAPKGANELVLIHSGGLRESSEVKGTAGPVIDKLRTYTFGRELDRTPVMGGGSKIVVYVGDRGKIVGMVRNWREVATSRPVHPSEIKSEKEAESEIRKVIARSFASKEAVELAKVTLAYFDNNGKYIQPAYFYEATETTRLGKVPYFGAVAALRSPPERVEVGSLEPEARKALRGSPGKGRVAGQRIRD